LVCASNKMYIF